MVINRGDICCVPSPPFPEGDSPSGCSRQSRNNSKSRGAASSQGGAPSRVRGIRRGRGEEQGGACFACARHGIHNVIPLIRGLPQGRAPGHGAAPASGARTQISEMNVEGVIMLQAQRCHRQKQQRGKTLSPAYELGRLLMSLTQRDFNHATNLRTRLTCIKIW